MRARGASAARKDPGGQGTLRTRRNLLAKLRVDVGRPRPQQRAPTAELWGRALAPPWLLVDTAWARCSWCFF